MIAGEGRGKKQRERSSNGGASGLTGQFTRLLSTHNVSSCTGGREREITDLSCRTLASAPPPALANPRQRCGKSLKFFRVPTCRMGRPFIGWSIVSGQRCASKGAVVGGGDASECLTTDNGMYRPVRCAVHGPCAQHGHCCSTAKRRRHHASEVWRKAGS